MKLRLPSAPAQVLWCLVLGIGVGMVGPLKGVVAALEPLGTLWVSAIRMTVIPLVVALLIVSVASARSTSQVGRLGARAFVLFLVLLGIAAAFTALVAPWAFSPLSLDPAATAELRASAQLEAGATQGLTFTNWVLSLIPQNPIRAAADGALLPVIVFTLLFAFALTRLEPEVRDLPFRFFDGIAKTLLVIVRWVLALAPVGVFALALTLGARLGAAAAGALGYYIGLVIILHAVTGAGLYLFATTAGGVPLRAFARAVFPAQAVAFTSRSSLAALPALVEGARDQLKLPSEISGFVLPLAVSVFKLTSPIYWTLGALLVGKLYGIELAPMQLVTVGAASIALNAATPGIPSGGLLIQAPLYSQIGLPVEGLGILIAIDAVPDMFKTAFNVTADMAVAAVLARRA